MVASPTPVSWQTRQLERPSRVWGTSGGETGAGGGGDTSPGVGVSPVGAGVSSSVMRYIEMPSISS